MVDDSIFMRTMLKSVLGRSGAVEVIGTAQNGREALKKIKQLKPDVVTLDVEMPCLTGLQVLERVMKDSPLPIVMVSTKTRKGAKMTFDALELGAVDYVAKPLADKEVSLEDFQEKVVQAVITAHAANRSRLGKQTQLKILHPRTTEIRTEGIIVAIGISAGGPATLRKLVPAIPKVFPPIVLTQHMPADFTGPFAKHLNNTTEITVKEAEHGDELIPGRLLLAPGDRHMRVARRIPKMVVTLDNGPKVAGFRPSVDVLFESAAQTFKSNAIGLVMTGMGNDGSNGVRRLKAAGARTLAQDKGSCVVYGMPKAAFETGCIDQVVSLTEIPDVLTRMLTMTAVSR